MLKFSNISKRFGDRVLFEDLSFSMSPGERLALIGRNGCGKSTLFKLIIGEDHPDDGVISIPRDYRIGHLEQHLHFTESSIVRDVCMGLPPEERDQEYRAEILLSGLGFSEEEMTRPASYFSGGFQIRVTLARVLVSEPNLLLLDEPTNYLDILSARWLTGFLRSWPNELILISHDRDFLDQVTTHTMLLHRSSARKISGGTAKIYNEVAAQEELYEKTRLNEEKKRREVEVFINRFRAKATKAAAVQSRIKALEKMGEREELSVEETLDFEFHQAAPFYGKYLLEADNVSFSYPPANGSSAANDQVAALIKNLTVSIGKNDRIGVIGKNGKGKSTLLRVLAGELSPTSGSVSTSPKASLGYFGQTNIARLSPTRTIEDEISISNPSLHRTKVRAICGTMMFSGDNALKKIGVLSGGEKSRVLLGKILALPTNLLFLDEPTNHLDMESIDALVESTRDYDGAIVIVTHSERILRELATRLIIFQGSGPTLFEGTYDDFLEKIGWENDQSESMSKSKNQRPAENRSGRDRGDRKERAKRVAEKSRTLRPLEAQKQTIEDRICALESEITKANQELIEASNRQDAQKITELSRTIAQAQREIDSRFGELEEVSAQYDQALALFADL